MVTESGNWWDKAGLEQSDTKITALADFTPTGGMGWGRRGGECPVLAFQRWAGGYSCSKNFRTWFHSWVLVSKLVIFQSHLGHSSEGVWGSGEPSLHELTLKPNTGTICFSHPTPT